MRMDADDQIQYMFAERVSNPLAWFSHARSLLAAARATTERANVLIDVNERSDMLNVAAMLYGFSLENLFKAIWILKKHGPPYTGDWIPEANFPSELKTHDLIALAKMNNMDMSSDYELSLSMLSDVITWSGRYPCSLKGDEGSIGRFPLANEHAETIFKNYSRPFTSIS